MTPKQAHDSGLKAFEIGSIMENFMPGFWASQYWLRPAESGWYYVHFFTGVTTVAYWNSQKGCWQRDERNVNLRNVHRGVQQLMHSRNSYWYGTSVPLNPTSGQV